MSYNEVLKVFDLSSAPTDLREAEDLALLRPIPGEDVSAILTLQVGKFDSQKEGPIYDCITSGSWTKVLKRVKLYYCAGSVIHKQPSSCLSLAY